MAIHSRESMDRGAWWATVCGVAQSRTEQLSSSSIRRKLPTKDNVRSPWLRCCQLSTACAAATALFSADRALTSLFRGSL